MTPTLKDMADDEAPPVAPAEAGRIISAVNLKLPPFWPGDPEVWFAQVEAQFTTRGITSQKTKFDYIMASLSPEIATEVRDLILKPPVETPYTVLKAQLIKRTAASEQRKLQQLLNDVDLGDRKPTQLLRRMQQLLGDRTDATEMAFLRQLFLQRLPSNIRMVLASTHDDVNLDTLAELADKIVEVAAPSQASVAAFQPPPITAEVDSLRTEVSRLQELVKSMSTQSRYPRPRSPSPAR